MTNFKFIFFVCLKCIFDPFYLGVKKWNNIQVNQENRASDSVPFHFTVVWRHTNLDSGLLYLLTHLLTHLLTNVPAMSSAPSLLESAPPASRPTKPTFSFFWSACAPGNTPPFRDFCTMTDLRTYEAELVSSKAGGRSCPGVRVSAEHRCRKGGRWMKRMLTKQTSCWSANCFVASEATSGQTGSAVSSLVAIKYAHPPPPPEKTKTKNRWDDNQTQHSVWVCGWVCVRAKALNVRPSVTIATSRYHDNRR